MWPFRLAASMGWLHVRSHSGKEPENVIAKGLHVLVSDGFV